MPEEGAIITTSGLGTELRTLLESDELRPGDAVSYQMCKSIYIGHPLGAKMAEAPIRLAQSQEREINIPDSPEEEVVEAFVKEWHNIQASRLILNLATQSRVYGIASIVMGEAGVGIPNDAGNPVDLRSLWDKDPYFNVLDPLNTAGSLVTSQDPNSPLYQKWGDLIVQGQRYHRSRCITLMNEEPFYIAWSSSAYGFVGRSVYQRALYPLKSFVQTMITDDMVTRKAGLLVARLEQPGSIVDRVMQAMFGIKRALLKQARTDNVISIGTNEIIETVNLRNVHDSMDASRNNVIKNIATAADMPAKLLTQESFVEGFGEGTQDAYAVGQYVDRVRQELAPAYRWFDIICQYRAWNEEFYKTIQRKYPEEYGQVPYLVAFYRWRNAFRAVWPDVIKEKPSEAADRDKVKLDALIGLIDKLMPLLDSANKAHLVQTVYGQLNTMEALFGGAKFELDAEELVDHMDEESKKEAEEAKQMREATGQGGDQEEVADRGDAVVAMLRGRGREFEGARA
jgi:hypothetical protein